MEFSRYHPAINFLYFAAVLAGTILFRQPVYLALSYVCAFLYLLKLRGLRALIPGLGQAARRRLCTQHHRERMRRLQTILLPGTHMQPRPQYLQSLQRDRHRKQVELLSEQHRNPFRCFTQIHRCKLLPRAADRPIRLRYFSK